MGLAIYILALCLYPLVLLGDRTVSYQLSRVAAASPFSRFLTLNRWLPTNCPTMAPPCCKLRRCICSPPKAPYLVVFLTMVMCVMKAVQFIHSNTVLCLLETFLKNCRISFPVTLSYVLVVYMAN